MHVRVALDLPREALSVPVIRQVLGDALRSLGAAEEGVADILVAISEACTNVLDHAGPTDTYEIIARVDDCTCVVKVVDRGRGFDPSAITSARLDDETGRGIELMRALVDDVVFEGRPEGGTVVYLQKRLGWGGHSVVASPALPPARRAS